jgi:hypothetical protein
MITQSDVIAPPRKRIDPWAHAGAEPRLRDLLKDSIVVSVMAKDKVSLLELIRLIWGIRHKIQRKKQ